MSAKVTKGIFILAIVMGVNSPLFSQWVDDFSDNEFSSDPTWNGITADFIIEGEMLRLNAPAVTGSSYLATPSNISLEATWSFYVKLDFNPSSSNFIEVYLMADSLNIENAENGYFVKIGGSSDEVSLYKIEDGSETLLIDGVDDRVDLGSVEINVEVARAANGDWELSSKLDSETGFVSEGMANDLAIQQSAYFGVYCKYTSTRSTKFYVDDISVSGNPYVDLDPPLLLNAYTLESTKVGLVFNEPMDTIEAKNIVHYNLNDSIAPNQVEITSLDSIVLVFEEDMVLINTLAIETLPDSAGNLLDTLVQVVFVDPAPHLFRELVINEIFPDPNPQEDLPVFEFIELYNNTGRIIDVEGWQFTDGSKIATLESGLIYPDSFIIICTTEAQNEYATFGETMGLANWPSLNNGGDPLQLIDGTGQVIDSLTYSLEWYKDAAKDNGGWSLEQINPYNDGGDENWAASIDPSGGTPGRINSTFDLGLDEEAPIVVAVTTPAINQIKLVFNEPVDTLDAKTPVHYLLNGVNNPSQVFIEDVEAVLLEFSSNIDLTNTLSLTAVADTVGNKMDTLMQIYYIDPAPYNYREVVINEIFPDPNPQEDLPLFEFVELLNTTDRIIDLEGWTYGDGSKSITLPSLLLFPDSLLIICPEKAKEDYQSFGKVLALANWPSLNNGRDSLRLMSKTNMIDSVIYSSNWYNDNVKDNGGWSLEQVNPLSKCMGSFNWVASVAPAGGTPGKTNSLFSAMTDLEPPTIVQALVTDSLVEVWFSEFIPPNNYVGMIFPDGDSATFQIKAAAQYSFSYLSSPINGGTEYSIEIPLEDCNGNNTTAFSELIPVKQPNNGDIVINEVLFNPYSGGSDFVELANTTTNYYNLKNYYLTNGETESIISDTTLLLAPEHYLAFSEDILFLKNQYLAPDSALVESDLPSFPDDESDVVLKTNRGEAIDSVFYSDDFHFSLISNTEGISLERIATTEPSTKSDNWRSAAETVGFASPGYENSQARVASTEGSIAVGPEIITPNNNGQDDFCQISFDLDQQAQTLSISVYNINGQLVKTIANNALIPPSGFYTWDGTDQQGGVLPTAHYIIISEVVTSDGRTMVFRNKVVVANGF